MAESSADNRRLIRAAWQTTLAGITAVKAGATVGDIGHAISSAADKLGCAVIQDYVGQANFDVMSLLPADLREQINPGHLILAVNNMIRDARDEAD